MTNKSLTDIIEECAYTIPALSDKYGINKVTLYSWASERSRPSKKHEQKVEKMINDIKNQKKLQKRSSFGYATPEQIKQLNELGLGPTRNALLKQIAQQNKNKGKVTR